MVDSPAEKAGDRQKTYRVQTQINPPSFFHASSMKILAIKLPRIVQLFSPGLCR